MEVSVLTRRKRRKKVVYECPNPLFERWLKEWKEEAVAKGWKTQYIYGKALKSLQRYPLPLRSGMEAKILEHFGDKLCKMLDDKLKEYKITSHTQQPEVSNLPSTASLPSNNYTKIILKHTDNDDRSASAEPTKKKRKTQPKRKYIPAPRSGAHALLSSLLKLEIDKNALSVQKNVLINFAQPLCDKSFITPDPGSYYTAWSSMGSLIKKGLVIKSSHPPKYSLTDLGRELAITLLETDQALANETDSNKNNVLPQCNSNTNKKFVVESNAPILIEDNHVDLNKVGMNSVDCHMMNSVPETAVLFHCNDTESVFSSAFNSSCDTTVFLPGTFDIILCVDNREVCTSKNSNVAILSELKKLGVKYDIRKLHIGDFLWVARKHVVSGVLDDEELVLDYIVERKRMDDLAYSIKDGRFREQKFRLRNCGIKKPIYLIEEYGTNQYHGIPEASLNQAIINTQIVDGFQIKRATDVKASVRYLTLMTCYLQSLYSQKKLTSHPRNSNNNINPFSFMLFNDFNSSAMKKKQLTIREMFAKHLLQLKGLSVDKAVAIVENFPAPAKLLDAYNMCDSLEAKEKLLKDIKYGKNRRIGSIVSKSLCRLYCMRTFS